MLGSAQGVNIVCSVLRNKLMAIWIGAAGVGLNSILVNATALISNATQLNIRDSAVRDLSVPMSAADLAVKTTVVRRWALSLGILGAIAAVVFAPLLSAMAYNGSVSYSIRFILLAPGIFASSYSAGEFAILQAAGRLKAIASASAAAGLAATAVSLPLIYFFGLASIVYVINIYAFAIAVGAYCVRMRGGIAAPCPDMKELWRQGRGFLMLGATISVSVLLTTLADYIFASFVNSRSGEAALGIFQSGHTLVNSYVGIIFSAISVEFYPRLTHVIGRPSASRAVMTHEMSLIIKLVTPVAIIFVFASDFIVQLLYSSSFDEIVPFVTFAIIGALYRGISLCYAYRILAAGDSKAYIFTETVSVSVGLALNIIAYSQWSYLGLGFSYIVRFAFYTALTAVVCKRRYGLVLPGRLIWLAAGATALILAAIALKSISC